MSGGSWDYLCYKLDDAADQLECSKDSLRQALGAHMRLIAKAMHDIEWVDSYDYAPGDEADAIRAVIGEDGDADDGSESMSGETPKPGEVEDFVPIERIPTADELAELRATLERAGKLPDQWRSESEYHDYGYSDALTGCADELEQALEGKP